MRLKQCRLCGAAFMASSLERTLCPACAAVSRATSLRPRTCRQCGAVFDGGPRAWYCPSCREERRKERQAGYRKNGSNRHLGDTDYCTVCGHPYIITGGLQRYCPSCAPEVIREKDRAASRAWIATHGKPDGHRSGTKLCVICGKPFVPGTAAITCSPECHRLRMAKTWSDADLKRGKRSTPSPIQRLDKPDKEQKK